MSMPNFPELPDITRENVLNQIVTSVAYEEFAPATFLRLLLKDMGVLTK
jgi:hypothetical protein